jgi:Uncharacterized conserved protein
MKLQPDFSPDTQMVSAYGPGYVEVNGVRHTSACVFAPQQSPKPWGAEHVGALLPAHIDALLLDPLPEVVLIGTGREQHLLPAALMRQLIRAASAGKSWTPPLPVAPTTFWRAKVVVCWPR